MRIDTAATRMRVLAFLLLATAACAQTTFPAWVFQKKTSASSASVPVVISGQNNKVFGLDGSGNLSLLTNGSGSSTLAGLGDVAITGIANEDLLRYDTNESKWLNISSETLLGAPVIALRDLADGVGALTNDGAGVLSWVSYQAADAELTALAGLTSAADKLPYFTGSGTASTATVTSASRTLLSKATVGQMLEYIGAAASFNGSSIDTFSITSTSPSDPASLNVNNTLGAGGVAMNFTNATGSLQLLFDNLTAARTQRFPNADGTLISTGNLTAITATGTVASGTWNGSAIGVAYGGTGSTSLTANNVLLGNGTSALQAVAPGTSGNVLTSNGTTWTSAAPAAGITINTTTTTGAASGDILTSNGTTVQKITPGANVASSLANAMSAGGTLAILGANIFTGQQVIALNGAASTPPAALTGTWYSGGTATTTKPQMLVEPSGTTSTGWSTSGTGLGVNAASGFTGNLFDFQVAGSSKFKYTHSGRGTLTVNADSGASHIINFDAGKLTMSNNIQLNNTLYTVASDVGDSSGVLRSRDYNETTTHFVVANDGDAVAATVQFGLDHATTATNQLIKAHDVTTGTGASMTIAGGKGSAAGGAVILATSASNGAPSAKVEARASGSVAIGAQSALATNAGDGFLYVPTCAGTPTGVPTSITGLVPIVVDSTNNKLYFYSGGAWRDAGP